MNEKKNPSFGLDQNAWQQIHTNTSTHQYINLNQSNVECVVLYEIHCQLIFMHE